MATDWIHIGQLADQGNCCDAELILIKACERYELDYESYITWGDVAKAINDFEEPLLEDYQRRVFVERNELFEKIERLYEFMRGSRSDKLDESQRTLLRAQLNSMEAYRAILDLRIIQF